MNMELHLYTTAGMPVINEVQFTTKIPNSAEIIDQTNVFQQSEKFQNQGVEQLFDYINLQGTFSDISEISRIHAGMVSDIIAKSESMYATVDSMTVHRGTLVRNIIII